MRLGDIANEGALGNGKPLDGIRVLALEQMQSLPYATMMLARLGAEVVKIENPGGGDIGRGSLPAFKDPDGRLVGATFSRNNFNKRSICVDLKNPQGRQLVLDMAPKFDVVAENFKGGTVERLGLAYDDVVAVHPTVVYLSISGFGHGTGEADSDWTSPYGHWPAYAAVAEAMSGLYDWARRANEPPDVSPLGAIGDIGSSLFGVIGVLAALRQRDHTGQAQFVDVAMFDAMTVFSDVATNFASLGQRKLPGQKVNQIIDGFEAADGWYIVQVGREPDFAKLANLIGKADWLDDERFATRAGWREHMDVIRAGLREWSGEMTSVEVCQTLATAGIAAAPCFDPEQVMADPHTTARHMFVEMERPDGEPRPVAVPGNPVKISGMADGPDTRLPWLGEHTDEVLAGELGFDAATIERMRADGVVA
jgi:crotonobetainyl-CoA:carnitine CoA-transferase CaiB-like acyl-CoA transferase